MTLKNSRPPLLQHFKICASICSHKWIQTGVMLSLIWDKFATYSTQEQIKHIVVNTDINQNCIISPMTVVFVWTMHCTSQWFSMSTTRLKSLAIRLRFCQQLTKGGIKYPHYCWLLISPTKWLVTRKASWRNYGARKYFALISNVFVVNSASSKIVLWIEIKEIFKTVLLPSNSYCFEYQFTMQSTYSWFGILSMAEKISK